MDLGVDLVEKIPGCVTRPAGMTERSAALTAHPFTGMEITEKGAQLMSDYVAQIREYVGMDVPLAADHFGHIGVNSCIRLGKALTKEVGKKDADGVFVVGADNKVTFRPVKVGIAGEQYFEVLSGLKPGEKIVSGTYQAIRDLKDGTVVRAAKPAKKGDSTKSS